MTQVQLKLHGDLASWNARCKVLRDLGSKEKPKGKPGNCITRMYAKTGWWPLKCKSELWEKAINQFGIKPQRVDASELTTELGPGVRIRQVVLDAFRGTFLNAAKTMKEEYASKGKRNKSFVPCTVFGKGFNKAQDLEVILENERKQEELAEEKVCGVCICDICHPT